MYERVTVITRKGQITIPVEIRQKLGLKVGDKIAVSLEEGEHSEASLRPIRSVAERTFGAVTARKRPENFKELREQFVEGQAEMVMAEGTDTPEQQ